ncbi:unnamed protein product [Mytilus coruscus]|uniref:Uncharacterized protein n=1 Tax=Mytilus coruscus TaxID=42192 RepID=A0A6J8AQJ9_MYTCO|nr:unnamed protein product [Mytilus coruscus]
MPNFSNSYANILLLFGIFFRKSVLEEISSLDVFVLYYAVDIKASFQNIKSEWYPEVSHHCQDVPIEPIPPNLLEGSEEYSSQNQSKEITFVTAYFNLGKVVKGPFKTFSTQTYYRWMKNYAFVYKDIILYTDVEDLAIKFKLERSHFPDHMTRIFLRKQNEFWAFGLKPKIEKIYNQPDYPKWYPNTVIKEKLVNTRYLAWMDLGYFRGNEKGIFSLKPPQNIKDDHIAIAQIDKYVDMTPKQIMFSNSVFLAGGLFIGRPEY